VHSLRNLQPFLIPSCGVLNSPLLLLQLFARTSRFSNYARVAYLTDGICPPLLLCSFLRGSPPSFFYSSYSFGLGRKARPVRSETLRLCSRALAIKRRPITIVIVVVVITVVISKRTSVENFTGSSAATLAARIDRRHDRARCYFFPFLHSG